MRSYFFHTQLLPQTSCCLLWSFPRSNLGCPTFQFPSVLLGDTYSNSTHKRKTAAFQRRSFMHGHFSKISQYMWSYVSIWPHMDLCCFDVQHCREPSVEDHLSISLCSHSFLPRLLYLPLLLRVEERSKGVVERVLYVWEVQAET